MFNFSSNISYLLYRNSKEEIQIKVNEKWKHLNSVSEDEISLCRKNIFDDGRIKIQEIEFTRDANNFIQKFFAPFITSKLFTIELDPEYFKFDVYFEKQDSLFKPVTAKRVLNTNELNFAINANFFDKNFQPQGWVVKNGHLYNRKSNYYTGLFFIKGDKVYFGPSSLLNEVPGKVVSAAQAYPSVMKNGTVFKYIERSDNPHYNSYCANYRSLAGMKENGKIIFILSNKGGVLSFYEITQIAKKLNVRNATMFDGGLALQYAIKIEGFSEYFHAFNTQIDLPFLSIKRMRSPVYIGIGCRTKLTQFNHRFPFYLKLNYLKEIG